MQIRLQHLFFVALLVSLVSLAYGLNYMYCSHIELTSVGDRIKFWHGDSIFGPLRVDGEISIMQDPQFFDYVITSAPDFWQGSAYNPGFHGPRPIFNAPALPFPQTVPSIRAQALAQGHYFNQGDTMMARVHIEGDSLKIWWTRRGLPFDTSSFSFHALPDSAVVFFDCSIVHLWGTVTTTLICGVAGRAGLEDNVLYASSNQNTGQLAPNHPEKFALVAEGEIKVLNTWANGREDSHGRGLSQPNPDSTSIA